MQINLRSLKGKIISLKNNNFNAISHAPIKGALALVLDVLVVKSQTTSLTPNHFLNHTLCFRSSSGKCNPTLNT